MENTGLVTRADLVRVFDEVRDEKIDAAEMDRDLMALQFASEDCKEYIGYVCGMADRLKEYMSGGLELEAGVAAIANSGILLGVRLVLNRPEGFGLRRESRGTASGAKFSRLSKGGARKAGKPTAGKGTE